MNETTLGTIEAAKFHKIADMCNSPFQEEAQTLLSFAITDLRKEHNRFCDQLDDTGYAKARRDELAGLRYDLKKAFARHTEGKLDAAGLHDVIDRIAERAAEIAEDAPDSATTSASPQILPPLTPPPPPFAADFDIPAQTITALELKIVDANNEDSDEDDENPDDADEAENDWKTDLQIDWETAGYKHTWVLLTFLTVFNAMLWFRRGHPPTFADWTFLFAWKEMLWNLLHFFFTCMVIGLIDQFLEKKLDDEATALRVMPILWSPIVVGVAWIVAIVFFALAPHFFSPVNVSDIHLSAGGSSGELIFGGIIGLLLVLGLRKLLPVFGGFGLLVKVALFVDCSFVCYVFGFHQTPWRFLHGAPFPDLAKPAWPFIIVCVLSAAILVLPEVAEWVRATPSRVRRVFFMAVILIIISIFVVRDRTNSAPATRQNTAATSTERKF